MESEQPAGEELVRDERFPVQGEPEIEVSIGTGRLAVYLDESNSDEVRVELRHDPSAGAAFSDGMNAMLSWVGEHFAEQFGTDLRTDPAEAIEQTRLEQTGNRLTITAPRAMPARNVPIAVTIYAPTGTHLNVKTSAASVTVVGAAGRADVSTGSGEVTVERAAEASKLRTGSGAIKLGTATDGLHIRTGSGDAEVRAVEGSASVVTGTGAIWFGETAGEVLARSGSGTIALADARSGSAELNSGSGDLRIGIGRGVLGKLDISSGSGRVLSELDVSNEPPDQEAALTVHARTGTGNAVVRGSDA